MTNVNFWVQLFSGTVLTLQLMLVALAIGFCIALLVTVCVQSKKVYLKTPANIFIFAVRGTPLLVQFFIIYYGSGQLVWLHHTFLWTIFKQPFSCAVITLALNTSAYTSVLMSAAIQSVPRGEIQACQALGLSTWKMYYRIIIPRAFHIILPSYSNEVVMILKGTSLASTITLMDLMGVTRHLIAMTYNTIPLFLLAGIIYLTLNSLIMGGFKLLERSNNQLSTDPRF